MSKRALFNVTVAGTNITTALMPVLLGLQVSDKVGTHTDSADLEIDDTEARIILPQKGADGICLAHSFAWYWQADHEVKFGRPEAEASRFFKNGKSFLEADFFVYS